MSRSSAYSAPPPVESPPPSGCFYPPVSLPASICQYAPDPPPTHEYPDCFRALNAAAHQPRLPPTLDMHHQSPPADLANTSGIDQSPVASNRTGGASPHALMTLAESASDVEEPDSLLSTSSDVDDSDDPLASPGHPKMANVGIKVVQADNEELGSEYDPLSGDNDHITLLRRPSIGDCSRPRQLRTLHPGRPEFYVPRMLQPESQDRPADLSMPPTSSAADSDSDLDEPEVREFMRRQREIKRRTRLSHGSSIGKRPFSDRDDPDTEDMRLHYRESEVFASGGGSFSGERRTRRRVGERRSGAPSEQQSQPERILELEEPDSDDEIQQQFDYELDRELPYFGLEIMDLSLVDRDLNNGVPLYPQS